MNANSYLEKSVGSDFPHYHISIRFQVYIIGTSLDATITTLVDSSIANQIAIINPDGNQYLVGQTYNGLQLSHKQIYFDMNHDITSGATIDIKIQLIQNGINPYYWGINNFLLHFDMCHYSCNTCSGIGENQCTSCPSNSALDSSNYCVCVSGYIEEAQPYLTFYYCWILTYPCSACFPIIQNCLTDNFVGWSMTYTCTSCDVGYTLSADGLSCTGGCISLCSSCTDSTTCSACQSSAYLTASLICVTLCPIGFWGSTVDNKCYTCDSSCYTCDTSSTYCTACDSGANLVNNQCITQCAVGY